MKFVKIVATILLIVVGFAPVAVMLADVFWWILFQNVLVKMSVEQVISGVFWSGTIGPLTVLFCSVINE